MRCRLCGYEFAVVNMACHTGCPMGSHCNLICCPNCGYQVVDESKSLLVKLLHRLWPPSGQEESPSQGKRHHLNGISTVPLTHIPVGWQVQIQSMGDMPSGRLTQLSVFGLTPGETVEVLQHRPAPVIRIGETELALGKEILEEIWVRLGDTHV